MDVMSIVARTRAVVPMTALAAAREVAYGEEEG